MPLNRITATMPVVLPFAQQDDAMVDPVFDVANGFLPFVILPFMVVAIGAVMWAFSIVPRKFLEDREFAFWRCMAQLLLRSFAQFIVMVSLGAGLAVLFGPELLLTLPFGLMLLLLGFELVFIAWYLVDRNFVTRNRRRIHAQRARYPWMYRWPW